MTLNLVVDNEEFPPKLWNIYGAMSIDYEMPDTKSVQRYWDQVKVNPNRELLMIDYYLSNRIEKIIK